MKSLIHFGVVSFLFLSSISFAYTQCERPVNNVWASMTSAQSVWITFSDGGSSIYKRESQITPGQMSRFTSFALTAQTTGKKLIVRYPEDGLSCPPTGSPRNDVEGIWIKGQP